MVTLPGERPRMHTTNGDGIDMKNSATARPSTTEAKEAKGAGAGKPSGQAKATGGVKAPPRSSTDGSAPAPNAADGGDGGPRKQLEFSHAIKYVNAIKVGGLNPGTPRCPW